MNTLPGSFLRGRPDITTGPSPLLARRSFNQRVVAPDWPLLQETAGRLLLARRIRAALLRDDGEDSWTAAAGDAADPPALFIARLLAHTAVVLQCVAGHPVSRWRGSVHEADNTWLATWEYLLPKTGRAAGAAAAELMAAAATADVGFEYASEAVERVCSAVGNGVVEVVLEGAYRRGLPFAIVDPTWPVHAFGHGSAMRRLMTSIAETQGHISTIFTKDKAFSLRILREAGFPVPQHRLARSEQEAVATAEALGYPVVVKPSDQLRSKGVSVNLQSGEAVRQAFRAARAYSSSILVENHLPGLPYRILTLGGTAVAAMRRSVPMVTGDGASNLQTLIDRTNAVRSQALLKSASAPRKINIGNFRDELERCLAEQGLTLESVPEVGREVQLAFMAQTGRGGENLDVTAKIHPDNLTLAESVAQVLEMPILGLDFMTDDIARSWREGRCGINEVNSEPAFSLHQRATAAPRDVVGPYFDLVFGSGQTGRIPIVCTLGAAGATLLGQLERAVERLGLRCGVAAGDDEARVGRFQLPATSLARQPAARILTDPRVDWALVALSAADFAQGLAFDRCTACYLTPLPDADLDGNAQLIRQAKLMTEEVTDTLILPQRDVARWGRHLDLSCRRVITLVSDGLPDGTSEALQLSGGNLFHHHEGRCDRWLSLDGTVAESAEALLLTAASLLAAGQHPREIADALATQP